MIPVRTGSSHFRSVAVEGKVSSGAKGIVPDVGRDDTDSEWQPM